MKILAFLLLFFLVVPLRANAEAMTSANYRIESDVVSGGGSSLMESTNYDLQGTLGEFFATTSASTNYRARGGFWQTSVEGNLNLSVDDASIGLGTLSASAVGTDSLVATVTSTAPRGYTLMIISDGNLRSGGNTIDAVSDGSVTAGSEEYGFSTSGVDGQFNATDTSISDHLFKTIASNTDPVSGRQTTVSFKAAITAGTTAGSYSQTVTLILTANF